MSSISVCPTCQALLALPESACGDVRIGCTRCGEEYLLALSPPREPLTPRVLQQRLVDEPASEETVGYSPSAPTLPDVAALGSNLDALLSSFSTEAVQQPSTVGETIETPNAAAELPAGDAQLETPSSAPPEPPRFEFNFSSLASKRSQSPGPMEPPSQTLNFEREVPPDAAEELTPTFEPLANRYANEEHLEAEPSPSVTEDEFAVDPTQWSEMDERDEGNVEHAGAEAEFSSAVDDELDVTPRSRGERRGSPLRTLVGASVFGVIGILLGSYALLWIGGPSRDVLQMQRWLPTALLPADQSTTVAGVSPPSPSLPPGVTEPQPQADAPKSDAQSLAFSEPTAGDANVALPTEEPETPPPAATEVAEAEPAADPTEQISDDADRYDPAVTPAAANVLATARDVLDEPSKEASPYAPVTEPVERIWPTTPLVGNLKQTHYYKVAELVESTAAAEEALPQILAGDLSKPETVPRMGQAYIAMCEVAERMTLLDPNDYSSALLEAKAEAERVLRAAASNADSRRDLAVIASRWLEHDKRRTSGVLFIGEVVSSTTGPEWIEQTMRVAIGDRTIEVPVLADRPLLSVGDQGIVSGIIVENPADMLTDYAGAAAQVVIAGTVSGVR